MNAYEHGSARVAYEELLKAMRRLESDQGRISRRNARAAFAKAVRKLRKAVDEHFPAVRVREEGFNEYARELNRKLSQNERLAAKARRLAARKNRLQRLGYVALPAGSTDSVLRACALAGVKVKTTADRTVWVRPWVIEVYRTTAGDSARAAELRKLKGNPQAQRAYMARNLLAQQPQATP